MIAKYLTVAALGLSATIPGCLTAWGHFGPVVGLILLALSGIGVEGIARRVAWESEN